MIKRFTIKPGVLLFGLSLILLACGAEKEEGTSTQEQLIGKWEVIEAYRNGNLAESLEDLYFEFYGDGVLKTNVLGSSQQTTYTLEGDNILQDGGERGIPVEYTINEISDTTLSLSTVLRRYNFKFDLGKKIELE